MAENTDPLPPQQQLDDIVRALQERGGNISLMVAGETGTGKSTLINTLLGLKDPNNLIGLDDDIGGSGGDDGVSETKSVSLYEGERNEIIIKCWDTPGLEDTRKHSYAKIIAQMSVKTNGKLDLLLYCIKYEIGMRVKDAHIRMIHEITKAFKSDIWQRAVFVMTMVNTMLPSVTEQQHKRKLENIRNQLRDILRENGVPDDIASHVPLVTAGLEKGNLPHETTEWTAKLFGQCVDKNVKPSLLKIRYEKIYLAKMIRVISGGVAATAGAGIGAGVGAIAGGIGGPILIGALLSRCLMLRTPETHGPFTYHPQFGSQAAHTGVSQIGLKEAFDIGNAVYKVIKGLFIVSAGVGAAVGAAVGAKDGADRGLQLGYDMGDWIAKFDKEIKREIELKREMESAQIDNEVD